jgi:hypothetical protein
MMRMRKDLFIQASRSPIFRACAAFGILQIAYVVIGISYLGFVRDDWMHYVNMRRLFESGLGNAFQQLVTNQWIGGHELRIFFGAFLTHLFVSVLPGAQVIAYLILLLMQVTASCVAAYLFFKFTARLWIALALGVLLTFGPSISQPAIWLNNLFFVQPWFFLCLTSLALIKFRSNKYLWVLVVTVLGACTVFSGEAFIPATLIVLTVGGVWKWKHEAGIPHKIWCLTPVAIVLGLLATYSIWIVEKPQDSHLDFENLKNFRAYLQGALQQTKDIWSYGSEYYGHNSIWFNGAWLVILILAIAAICVAIFAPRTQGEATKQKSIVKLSVLLFVLFLATLAPMAVGVVTGSRPGPDLRYLYAPSIFALIVFMSLVALIAETSPFIVLVKQVIAVICIYAFGLTTYNIMIVWDYQRSVDAMIWQQIDAKLVPGAKAIVTFNPNHMYLMAPYRSNAVSDFQADWGVGGRIMWNDPARLTFGVYRDAQVSKSGGVSMRGYYGDDACKLENVTSDSIIYLTYDYGDEFSSLKSSPLLVTNDFSEYQQSRAEILAKYPESVKWDIPANLRLCP